jgi:transposase InsO family protein
MEEEAVNSSTASSSTTSVLSNNPIQSMPSQPLLHVISNNTPAVPNDLNNANPAVQQSSISPPQLSSQLQSQSQPPTQAQVSQLPLTLMPFQPISNNQPMFATNLSSTPSHITSSSSSHLNTNDHPMTTHTLTVPAHLIPTAANILSTTSSSDSSPSPRVTVQSSPPQSLPISRAVVSVLPSSTARALNNMPVTQTATASQAAEVTANTNSSSQASGRPPEVPTNVVGLTRAYKRKINESEAARTNRLYLDGSNFFALYGLDPLFTTIRFVPEKAKYVVEADQIIVGREAIINAENFLNYMNEHLMNGWKLKANEKVRNHHYTTQLYTKIMDMFYERESMEESYFPRNQVSVLPFYLGYSGTEWHVYDFKHMVFDQEVTTGLITMEEVTRYLSSVYGAFIIRTNTTIRPVTLSTDTFNGKYLPPWTSDTLSGQIVERFEEYLTRNRDLVSAATDSSSTTNTSPPDLRSNTGRVEIEDLSEEQELPTPRVAPTRSAIAQPSSRTSNLGVALVSRVPTVSKRTYQPNQAEVKQAEDVDAYGAMTTTLIERFRNMRVIPMFRAGKPDQINVYVLLLLLFNTFVEEHNINLANLRTFEDQEVHAIEPFLDRIAQEEPLCGSDSFPSVSNWFSTDHKRELVKTLVIKMLFAKVHPTRVLDPRKVFPAAEFKFLSEHHDFSDEPYNTVKRLKDVFMWIRVRDGAAKDANYSSDMTRRWNNNMNLPVHLVQYDGMPLDSDEVLGLWETTLVAIMIHQVYKITVQQMELKKLVDEVNNDHLSFKRIKKFAHNVGSAKDIMSQVFQLGKYSNLPTEEETEVLEKGTDTVALKVHDVLYNYTRSGLTGLALKALNKNRSKVITDTVASWGNLKKWLTTFRQLFPNKILVSPVEAFLVDWDINTHIPRRVHELLTFNTIQATWREVLQNEIMQKIIPFETIIDFQYYQMQGNDTVEENSIIFNESLLKRWNSAVTGFSMLVNSLGFSKFNHFTFDEFIRELLKLVRNGQSVSCKDMRIHGVDSKTLSAGPAYASRDEEDGIPEPMSSAAVSTTNTSPVSVPRTTTLTSSDRNREDLHAESQFSSGEEDEMILPSTSHSQTSTSTSSSGHSTSSGRGTNYRPTAGTTMRAAINTAGMAGATYNPTTGVVGPNRVVQNMMENTHTVGNATALDRAIMSQEGFNDPMMSSVIELAALNAVPEQLAGYVVMESVAEITKVAPEQWVQQVSSATLHEHITVALMKMNNYNMDRSADTYYGGEGSILESNPARANELVIYNYHGTAQPEQLTRDRALIVSEKHRKNIPAAVLYLQPHHSGVLLPSTSDKNMMVSGNANLERGKLSRPLGSLPDNILPEMFQRLPVFFFASPACTANIGTVSQIMAANARVNTVVKNMRRRNIKYFSQESLTTKTLSGQEPIPLQAACINWLMAIENDMDFVALNDMNRVRVFMRFLTDEGRNNDGFGGLSVNSDLLMQDTVLEGRDTRGRKTITLLLSSYAKVRATFILLHCWSTTNVTMEVRPILTRYKQRANEALFVYLSRAKHILTNGDANVFSAIGKRYIQNTVVERISNRQYLNHVISCIANDRDRERMTRLFEAELTSKGPHAIPNFSMLERAARQMTEEDISHQYIHGTKGTSTSSQLEQSVEGQDEDDSDLTDVANVSTQRRRPGRPSKASTGAHSQSSSSPASRSSGGGKGKLDSRTYHEINLLTEDSGLEDDDDDNDDIDDLEEDADYVEKAREKRARIRKHQDMENQLNAQSHLVDSYPVVKRTRTNKNTKSNKNPSATPHHKSAGVGGAGVPLDSHENSHTATNDSTYNKNSNPSNSYSNNNNTNRSQSSTSQGNNSNRGYNNNRNSNNHNSNSSNNNNNNNNNTKGSAFPPCSKCGGTNHLLENCFSEHGEAVVRAKWAREAAARKGRSGDGYTRGSENSNGNSVGPTVKAQLASLQASIHDLATNGTRTIPNPQVPGGMGVAMTPPPPPMHYPPVPFPHHYHHAPPARFSGPPLPNYSRVNNSMPVNRPPGYSTTPTPAPNPNVPHAFPVIATLTEQAFTTPIKYVAGLMTVPLSIGVSGSEAMVDTGAQVNMISHACYTRILNQNDNVNVQLISSRPPVSILGLGNQPVETTQGVLLKLTFNVVSSSLLNGSSVLVTDWLPFIVSPQLMEKIGVTEIILGMTFFDKNVHSLTRNQIVLCNGDKTRGVENGTLLCSPLSTHVISMSAEVVVLQPTPVITSPAAAVPAQVAMLTSEEEESLPLSENKTTGVRNEVKIIPQPIDTPSSVSGDLLENTLQLTVTNVTTSSTKLTATTSSSSSLIDYTLLPTPNVSGTKPAAVPAVTETPSGSVPTRNNKRLATSPLAESSMDTSETVQPESDGGDTGLSRLKKWKQKFKERKARQAELVSSRHEGKYLLNQQDLCKSVKHATQEAVVLTLTEIKDGVEIPPKEAHVTKKPVKGYDLLYKWDRDKCGWHVNMGSHVILPAGAIIRLNLEPTDFVWPDSQVNAVSWKAKLNSDYWFGNLKRIFSLTPLLKESDMKVSLTVINNAKKTQMLHKNDTIAFIAVQSNVVEASEELVNAQLRYVSAYLKAIPSGALVASGVVKELYTKAVVAFGGLQLMNYPGDPEEVINNGQDKKDETEVNNVPNYVRTSSTQVLESLKPFNVTSPSKADSIAANVSTSSSSTSSSSTSTSSFPPPESISEAMDTSEVRKNKERSSASQDSVHFRNEIEREAAKKKVHELIKQHSDQEELSKAEMLTMIDEFADVFLPPTELRTTNISDCFIRVLDSQPPVQQQKRRIPDKQEEQIMQEVDEMVNKGVIEASSSPWAANIVVVNKKDGTKRYCVDYRDLNKVTIKDSFPLPRIDDLLDKVGKTKSKYFTTLDLRSGYWQVKMSEESKEKTAFYTPNGLHQFKVMPFGLVSAPSIFQRIMNKALGDLIGKCCLDYIDDIIVFSATYQEHIQNLKEVFRCLHKAGLVIKLEKCRFFQKQVQYLGHVISEHGVAPDPAKVKALQDFTRPTCVRALQSFLGLANYYRKFINKYSEICSPLFELLRGKGAKGANKTKVFSHQSSNPELSPQSWKWGPDQQWAFERIKVALSTAPVLAHFSPTDTAEHEQLCLETDASEIAAGAVLSQLKEGKYHPIAYFSKTFSPTESRYSATEREGYGVYLAIKEFRHYLYGRPFTVIVDCKALPSIFSKGTVMNTRLANWSQQVTEYNFRIIYRPGTKNYVADALSRQEQLERVCATNTNVEAAARSYTTPTGARPNLDGTAQFVSYISVPFEGKEEHWEMQYGEKVPVSLEGWQATMFFGYVARRMQAIHGWEIGKPAKVTYDAAWAVSNSTYSNRRRERLMNELVKQDGVPTLAEATHVLPDEPGVRDRHGRFLYNKEGSVLERLPGPPVHEYPDPLDVSTDMLDELEQIPAVLDSGNYNGDSLPPSGLVGPNDQLTKLFCAETRPNPTHWTFPVEATYNAGTTILHNFINEQRLDRELEVYYSYLISTDEKHREELMTHCGYNPRTFKYARFLNTVKDLYIEPTTGMMMHVSHNAAVNRVGGLSQIVIPRHLYDRLLQLYHSGLGNSHVGGKRMYATLLLRFWWPTMYQDVTNYVAACPLCRVSKPHKQGQEEKVPYLIRTMPTPRGPADIISYDFVTNMQPGASTSQVKTHVSEYVSVLVIIDHYSRWTEAIPLKSRTSKAVAKALLQWCVKFGFPRLLISDREKSFASEVHQTLLELMGITPRLTSAYHPQSNGTTERVNETLLNMLRAHILEAVAKYGEIQPWETYLPGILLAYRTTVHTGMKDTPSYLFLGRDIRLPIDLLIEDALPGMAELTNEASYAREIAQNLRDSFRVVSEAQLARARNYEKKYLKDNPLQLQPKVYEIDDLVLVRPGSQVIDPRLSKYSQLAQGPYRVVKRFNENASYELQLVSDPNPANNRKIHVSRLIPYTANLQQYLQWLNSMEAARQRVALTKRDATLVPAPLSRTEQVELVGLAEAQADWDKEPADRNKMPPFATPNIPLNREITPLWAKYHEEADFKLQTQVNLPSAEQVVRMTDEQIRAIPPGVVTRQQFKQSIDPKHVLPNLRE